MSAMARWPERNAFDLTCSSCTLSPYSTKGCASSSRRVIVRWFFADSVSRRCITFFISVSVTDDWRLRPVIAARFSYWSCGHTRKTHCPKLGGESCVCSSPPLSICRPTRLKTWPSAQRKPSRLGESCLSAVR